MFNLKNSALALVAASTVASAVPATAAVLPQAQAGAAISTQWNEGWDDDDRWEHGRRDWRGHGRHDRYDRYDRDYGRGYDRGYDRNYYRSNDRGYYGDPVYRNTRVWRGNDGRYYCRRSNGTTGLLIGGAAGALIGREVAGNYGDRTLGAILGAAGGALLGREVDRGGSRCR
ncbi:glycine zipper 2TM domain-containing protein [Novosphingobium taihuense]|uniref:17 kDa surface antigen n=1 Tax=Novosphingobium taihuense TaxID=260085 RepID=A0A7W7ABP1_9SPHN|nr:glycine zipper 2TM domain-containing protein [Novosphingobium taihuense]MBB4613242.1 hypothetical protein [Novosphingobium taihuense]TWH85383.1 glycine zipper 2TM protein [Novosphingobium taihuense]